VRLRTRRLCPHRALLILDLMREQGTFITYMRLCLSLYALPTVGCGHRLWRRTQTCLRDKRRNYLSTKTTSLSLNQNYQSLNPNHFSKESGRDGDKGEGESVGLE
jgi:hypothetical protein